MVAVTLTSSVAADPLAVLAVFAVGKVDAIDETRDCFRGREALARNLVED